MTPELAHGRAGQRRSLRRRSRCYARRAALRRPISRDGNERCRRCGTARSAQRQRRRSVPIRSATMSSPSSTPFGVATSFRRPPRVDESLACRLDALEIPNSSSTVREGAGHAAAAGDVDAGHDFRCRRSVDRRFGDGRGAGPHRRSPNSVVARPAGAHRARSRLPSRPVAERRAKPPPSSARRSTSPPSPSATGRSAAPPSAPRSPNGG